MKISKLIPTLSLQLAINMGVEFCFGEFPHKFAEGISVYLTYSAFMWKVDKRFKLSDCEKPNHPPIYGLVNAYGHLKVTEVALETDLVWVRGKWFCILLSILAKN